MVSLYDSGIYLVNGTEIVPESESGKVKALTGKDADQASARKGTIAYSILEAHNTSGDMEHLKLRFDSMASHDITSWVLYRQPRLRAWKRSRFLMY